MISEVSSLTRKRKLSKLIRCCLLGGAARLAFQLPRPPLLATFLCAGRGGGGDGSVFKNLKKINYQVNKKYAIN